MRRRWLLLLCLVFAVDAHAAEPTARCEPSYMPRCEWIEAGDVPLETVAARGEQTLRFDYSAFLSPESQYAIEVSRDRTGIVRVTVRAPLRRSASISQVVAPAIWPRLIELRARVIAQSAAALARIAVEHPQFLISHNGRQEVMCLDGGYLGIGSVLGGKAQELRLSDCATRAVDEIADQIHDAVYAQLPFCRVLEDGLNREDKLLFGCGSLGGDGAVAARFAPAILDFSKRNACAAAATDRAIPAADARLRIADSGTARGGVWRGRAIFAALCRRHLGFRVDRVVAGHDGLTAIGHVINLDGRPPSMPLPDCAMMSAGTQLWRIDGGKAKLEQWSIEKPAQVCRTPSPAPMPVRH